MTKKLKNFPSTNSPKKPYQGKRRKITEVDPKVAVVGELTEKQRRFAELVAAHKGFRNLSDLALEAGYGKGNRDSAASTATTLLKNPKVQRAISMLSEEIDSQFSVNLKTHLRNLAYIRNRSLESQNYGASVQAEVSRGKAAGLYVNQSVSLHHSSIDSMDKERVLEELKKLKSQYHSPSEEVLDAEYKIVRDAKIDSSGDRD